MNGRSVATYAQPDGMPAFSQYSTDGKRVKKRVKSASDLLSTSGKGVGKQMAERGMRWAAVVGAVLAGAWVTAGSALADTAAWVETCGTMILPDRPAGKVKQIALRGVVDIG